MHALKRTRLMWLAAVTLMLALAGCGGSGGDEKEPEPPTPPAPKIEPAVTQPGTPNGDPASASLNNAGGSLTSPDGKLTITIPEDALGEPTTLSIQPITNGAPGSHGPAYRLLPDGQAFARPVTLTFHYTDDDVDGSAPQLLGIATHLSDGTWQAIGGPQIDEAAHTVSISTSHFSDWSTFSGLKLFPTSGTVMVNKTKELSIRYCVAVADSYGVIPIGETGSLYNCDLVVNSKKIIAKDTGAGDEEIIPLPPPGHPTWKILSWAANGIDGGNDTVGRISTEGVYTAPASVPKNNPVAVSAKINFPGGSIGERDLLLVSNIKVVDEARGYSGSVSGTITVRTSEYLTTTEFTASNIRLERDEALPGDLMHYVMGAGTVQQTMTWRDLTVNPPKVRTFHSSQDSEAGAIMQIFDPVRSQGPDFARKFWLTISGFSNNVTGTPPGTALALSNFCSEEQVPLGAGAYLSYGDDASVLQGSFNRTCTLPGMPPQEVSMQWSLQIDEPVE
ncbi:MAG: hypothetical protein OZ923_03015 [Comamonadaceae bacterium]|nr:hypothetical protein [Burkholderiales bacterium]MEB2347563.1 hypothetical protein [Comamonadaceae bacterium]